MKYLAVFAASIALAGCDVTFGSEGAVITQTDSVISRMVPLGSRRAPAGAETPNGSQTAPTSGQPALERSRRTFSLSDLVVGATLPMGTTSDDVDQFRAAVVAAGCTISTRTQRVAIQSQVGVNAEKHDEIRDYLWRSGELDRNSGSYQLTSGSCADA